MFATIICWPVPACDFNQGLDAARFTSWHAEQIARLKSPIVRFAYDSPGRRAVAKRAVQLAQAAGLKTIRVYCLIGFDDTPDEARRRLEEVRKWGVLPNPMRYQPLDATDKNAYVAPAWTERELRDVQRYYSRLIWLGHIRFDDYEQGTCAGQGALFAEELCIYHVQRKGAGLMLKEGLCARYKYFSVYGSRLRRGRKTRTYALLREEGVIGCIEWYGPSRQYCFYPEAHTVWSDGCLADVRDFLAKLKAGTARAPASKG